MQQSDIKPVLPKVMMSQEMTKSIPELRGEGSTEDGKKYTRRNFALWKSEKEHLEIVLFCNG